MDPLHLEHLILVHSEEIFSIALVTTGIRFSYAAYLLQNIQST